jgi:hypothetical protein
MVPRGSDGFKKLGAVSLYLLVRYKEVIDTESDKITGFPESDGCSANVL